MVHFRVISTASTKAGWRIILTGGSQSVLAMDYSECTSVESLFTGGVNVWIHYPLLITKIVHRGSFGDLSNKQQYFHIEPIERHSNSVSFYDNSHKYSRPIRWI